MKKRSSAALETSGGGTATTTSGTTTSSATASNSSGAGGGGEPNASAPPSSSSSTTHPNEENSSSATPAERRAVPAVKRARKEVSYAAEVTDMMFVFGDVNAKSSAGNGESATLLESVVREYILALINEAATTVFKSGGSRITVEHIAFHVRKDAPKLNNLKEFLKWKEIRKNFAQDDVTSTSSSSLSKIKGTLNSQAAYPREPMKKAAKTSAYWSWEILNDLTVPGGDEEESDLLDDDLLAKPDFDSKNKERLRQADEMTKTMSKDEYMKYTEARKASFTYKKAKKFRDWLGPAISALKLNDDVIEVLGYLAWELVGTITQSALSIKKEMESHKSGYGNWRHKGNSILSLRLTPDQRDSEKAPLLPVHIREAARRIQHPKYTVVGFTASHIHKEHFV